MEVSSQAIGDHEIGGDYDTTIQWLIEEQFSITENFSRFYDWFFEEQIDITENIKFGFSQIFSDELSLTETFSTRLKSTGPIKKMTSVWEKTQEAMTKTRP
jgi:hypothetical protein